MAARIDPSNLSYRPQNPREYAPPIGLIGCGAIAGHHLKAYKNAGYNVVALCDVDRARAEKRRAEFFPEARLYTDYHDLLRRDDVEVVDIATHPPQRPQLIEDAVHAGKHVLSQKPFVLDLDVGQRLVDLADERNVRLAVNQNGRWAPHFSYARCAVDSGLLGELAAAHFSVHWDHSWVQGTEFENIHHLVLYDFAIHWFDILTCFFRARKPLRVFASLARAAGQTVAPPLLAQALVEYDGGQASLVFDAFTQFDPHDRTYLTGTKGTLHSSGVDLKEQTLTLTTADGKYQPELKGTWFADGFHGTMGELLCSIEENREPGISGAKNLESLELCFAAVASADRHEPVVPGSVRVMPGSIANGEL